MLLLFLIGGAISFGLWYYLSPPEFSPKTTQINDITTKQRILIASEGSKFKKAIADSIRGFYKEKNIFIKEIDVYSMFTVNFDNWDAVIILNSWEYWNPPKNFKNYVKKDPEHQHKFVILSTSGGYNEKLKNIDAISGESIWTNVSEYSTKIIQRLEEILKS